ncbi:MAG: succinate dehydrogenase assembly factor 2 [Alphaproteobacteria bacterium]
MDRETRLKRLHFRSWHRGFKEADLMLGHFADAHLAAFSDDQLDRYETLIASDDHDLYNWIVGRAPVPAEHDHDVFRMIQSGEHLQAPMHALVNATQR